jgi:protein SCO1/2
MKLRHILFCFTFFSFLTVRAHEGHHMNSDSETPKISGESIYNLKSMWTDQNGKSIKLSDLRGKKLILAMAYTSCQNACPIIVEDMKKIESKIGGSKDTVLALFSFDTEKDTPKKLKEYAEKKRLSDRWILLNGSKKSVRELAAVLGIKYTKLPSGDFDHSNIINLIDKEGIIRFQQVGLNKEPEEFLNQYSKIP